MPTSVYRQAEVPLTIVAGPAESVHIDGGGDGELELPENYDDDAYEGYEAMLQLQAEAAASESLALRLGSPRFERPSALSPFAEEVDEASVAGRERRRRPTERHLLAPVTERSANWRRQLAERSAADAQERRHRRRRRRRRQAARRRAARGSAASKSPRRSDRKRRRSPTRSSRR